MRYGTSGTASIELPQANPAWADVFWQPPAVTNKDDAKNITLHANRTMSARRVHRSQQESGMRRETDWMTPQQEPAEIRQPLRNKP